MTADFTIDTGDLEQAQAALELADELLDPLAAETIADFGEATVESVRREARRHRVTGELVDRVEIQDRRAAGMGSHLTVKAGGIVAPRIIGGTAPHLIKPRRARALAFGGSPAAFAESVRHPGTSPDPFVARGVRRADLDGLTDQAAATAAHRIAEAVDGGT